MVVAASFNDLLSSQSFQYPKLSPCSVFNASLYLKHGETLQKLNLRLLGTYLSGLSNLTARGRGLKIVLDTARKYGVEKQACAELERINPNQRCYNIDELADATILQPSSTGRTKKYYAIFKACGINDRKAIKQLDDLFRFRALRTPPYISTGKSPQNTDTIQKAPDNGAPAKRYNTYGLTLPEIARVIRKHSPKFIPPTPENPHPQQEEVDWNKYLDEARKMKRQQYRPNEQQRFDFDGK